MEALGSARLMESIPAQRAIATSVPRKEVADALDDEGASWDLLLQVARKDDAGEEEQSTISMTWSREDMEELLERATSDRVALTFDRDQLAEAVADVEAHGLREHALVFAVAATGALGTGATIASAMPTTEPGDPVAITQSAPAGQVTDVSSTGGYADAAVASEGGSVMTDVSSGGGYADAAVASEGGSVVTDVSSGGGYADAAVASEGGSVVTDVSSTGGYSTPAVESGGSSGFLDGIPTPSPVETGLAGGIALAIAGAAFVGRRGRPARPA